jgi:hypothetical protein
MSNQNTYAILGMFAIVITLYALKESHTHYLPDFFGLALATVAPRPSYAVGAVVILAIIRHSPLARGLADSVPRWLLVVVLPGARNMSIPDEESEALESAYNERISGGNSNNEMEEIPQPVAEKPPKIITLGESEVLARLVLAKKIGLTEAVKIGAAAKSGERYQQNSKLVKAAIDRLADHYPAGSTQKRFE